MNSGTAATLWFLAAGCRAAHPDTKNSSAADAPQSVASCPGFEFPVQVVAETIPGDIACGYAREAVRVLAQTGTSQGFADDDTSRVQSATVDAIAQIDSAGGPIAAWWIVTLRLADRAYSGEVRLNQRTGERSIRLVHR
jgi:hypothetical protein